MAWEMPVRGRPRVSSYWHAKANRKEPHGGIDIAVKKKPVFSVDQGTVRTVGFGHPINGTFIIVDHPDGRASGYVHLESVFVSAGSKVQKGEQIAISGNTGRVRGRFGGWHLHLAAWNRSGQLVNPARYLPQLRPPSPWPVTGWASGVAVVLVVVSTIATRSKSP